MSDTRPSIVHSAKPEAGAGVLWTVGHSTRPIDVLLELLQAQDIQVVVDVRAIPFSRRNPQFHQSALQSSLEASGIRYHHMPGLGGRRRSQGGEVNAGWRNAGFRGYADYMQTPPFQHALRELMDLARQHPTVILCAEAVPWRCHRSLIADALVVQAWTVLDIVDAGLPRPHLLPAWARVERGRVTYPAITG